MRRAGNEDLLIDIYRDKSVDIFPNGIGNRVDLAKISVGFFAGLEETSTVPLSGYAYADFIQNFSIVDDRNEVLNYAKIIEFSGKFTTDQVFTIALYMTSQTVEDKLLTIFEVGSGYTPDGGTITWLTGNSASDIDILDLSSCF